MRSNDDGLSVPIPRIASTLTLSIMLEHSVPPDHLPPARHRAGIGRHFRMREFKTTEGLLVWFSYPILFFHKNRALLIHQGASHAGGKIPCEPESEG